MSAILAAIDAAVGCQHCGGPLGDSPSDDFCSQDHQEAWHAARSERLVRYREPWGDHLYRAARDAMTVRTFRLPRQTGDLRADERALRRAMLAVSTPDQVAACRLRSAQLAERKAVAAAKVIEAMRAPLTEFGERLSELRQAMIAALRPLSMGLTALAEAAKRDAVDVAHRRSVMDRALEAKRTRGTGPAPRRLDGRRSRR